ncbi:amidase [Lusitaniella coriacea LEGE 07157]|uniref:Amidase n=1 Tax=Lusitaniella coriacea LEGE 07157 TaxID=945747 RepID=A0A8J7IT99_9CYAN|nr:amidase [Lusitaniella coriacea]MBE9116702.1 amidase [Lusitaniella coriacea LEGE 07157]
MNSIDLAFTSALQQSQLIRDRAISPLELTELYLERIQRLDPQVNSFFHVAAETARHDAQAKTEQLAQTADTSQLPPFFGVPTAIKDLNAVEKMPFSYGVVAQKANIATYDDGVVARMKQAGFILLGKTATSELGSMPFTEAPGFPPTRNPWNLDYTPGGSSGGAAAAIAAGFCSVAQGSDAGGSIRGPAFCCGLVGLKPSRGRISHAPGGDVSGIATNGPLGRTVADVAALLDVMSGYVTGDPYWLPNPETLFLEAMRQPLPQLRVAVSMEAPPIGMATEICQQPIRKVVGQLEAMGHVLEPGCPDFGALVEPFIQVWQAGVAAAGVPPQILSPINCWIAAQVKTTAEYIQAVRQLQFVSRQIVGFFENYDVLLLPVYLHPVIRVGEWADLSSEETFEKVIQWVAPCPPFNASGLPAISIPVGFDPNGLPLGVQLVGKPASEAKLLALAAQIEAANPWSQNRPAIANS